MSLQVPPMPRSLRIFLVIPMIIIVPYVLQDGPRADRYKWRDMRPLEMAKHKWVTGFFQPYINGVITLLITGRGAIPIGSMYGVFTFMFTLKSMKCR